MIMQFKLFLLLIGFCVISYHQATAENEGRFCVSIGMFLPEIKTPRYFIKHE